MLNQSLKGKKEIARKYKHGECICCKCCGIFGACSGLRCCCHFTRKESFLSIKQDRHCTDIPCCLLFIFTMVAQIGLFLYAVSDPRWLVYYLDLYGQLCAPWRDIRFYDVRVCVEHCNDTLTDEIIVTPSFDADLTEISVDVNPGLALDVSGYESVNILDAICIPDPDYASQIASAVLDRDYNTFESNFDKLSDKVQTASMFNIRYYNNYSVILFVSMLWVCMYTTLNATIIYGVTITVTFKYEIQSNNTNIIINILNRITNNMINNTINKECIESNDGYNIDNTQNNNKSITIVTATILVCNQESQNNLIAVIDNENILQSEIINELGLEADYISKKGEIIYFPISIVYNNDYETTQYIEKDTKDKDAFVKMLTMLMVVVMVLYLV